MRIPLNDLKRETLQMRDLLDSALKRVLDRGWYLMGEEMAAFEQNFADYLGAKYCIAVANGTDALELALRCIGIGTGDRVAVVPNAGMYGGIAVSRVGAEPVFVDVDGDSLCMSAESLERVAMLGNVRCVIITHLYGQLADMKSLLDVATRYGLRVIEDCAQAHGARLQDRFAGTFGDIACFSFYPTKNLGALGDAGAIVTDSPEHADIARHIRQYGWKPGKYLVDMPNGRNSRMDELQAAMLLAKLPQLENRNTRRKAIWQFYRDNVAGKLCLVGSADKTFVAHLCVVRSRQRDLLRQKLSDHGISTDIHYPVLDYRQAVWQGRYDDVSLPSAEQASDEIFTLPCFPEMTDAEIGYVADTLAKVC